MSSGTDGPVGKRTIVSFARRVLGARNLVMLVAGVVAGISVGVLGKDAVVVPLLGSVPGTPLGVVGIAVAFAVYQRSSCCGDCGETDCGCDDECGDSCSYDP